MHRVKVKVVEDALDANETIARANRDDFDRAGVTVVNFMGAPGAGKTSGKAAGQRATWEGEAMREISEPGRAKKRARNPRARRSGRDR